MKACIARGASEIGGSCVLLRSSSGSTIAIDVGLPLEATSDSAALPAGVFETELDAVLISHAHPDHYGLVEALPGDVPIYMGKATRAILKEAAFFTPLGLDREARTFTDRASFRVGDFEVLPCLVDHSAFDSYAFLIEADGRGLFYSGDLRAHGRTSTLFERLVDEPPDADVLLLEGTTISRALEHEAPSNEREVEDRCVEVFRQAQGMALACYSPQNIDRLVTVYRAALRSGRNLVLDLYAASIAAATGHASIPQEHWDRVRVYVPQSQRVRVKRSGLFGRVAELGAARIYGEELADEPRRWVMSFRPSMGAELIRAACLDDAVAMWSLWPGYLDRDPTTRRWFASNGIPLTVAHASGHATVPDLQRFAAAIEPGMLVPIHTAAPDQFESLFENVERHGDGDWWAV